MKFPSPVSAGWVAQLIGARLIGDADAAVAGINEIHRVEPGDLAFVDHPKYYDKCLRSDASFIIINAEVPERYGKTLLICDEPFEAYLAIVRHFRPFAPSALPIHPSAVIGEGSVLMPGVYVGQHAVIGRDCVIHPGVVIGSNCILGDRVIVQPGAVIGGDAFYYNGKKNREVWYKKMESCGRVIIEDDVEIGANTCIDRGVTHDTRIGRGTKIDNLVQIGHDVVVGQNCIIAAQVGIAGATTVGNGVSLWGQVGVSKTLHIGDNAQVMGQAGVTGNIEGNKTYMGTPAIDVGQKRREFVWVSRIPEMWEALQQLRKS